MPIVHLADGDVYIPVKDGCTVLNKLAVVLDAFGSASSLTSEYYL